MLTIAMMLPSIGLAAAMFPRLHDWEPLTRACLRDADVDQSDPPVFALAVAHVAVAPA
jgi:hypothetical protein